MGTYFTFFLIYLVTTLITLGILFVGYKLYHISKNNEEEVYVDTYAQRKREQELARKEELEKIELLKKSKGKN